MWKMDELFSQSSPGANPIYSTKYVAGRATGRRRLGTNTKSQHSPVAGLPRPKNKNMKLYTEAPFGHRHIGHRHIGHRHISHRHIGHRHIGHRHIGHIQKCSVSSSVCFRLRDFFSTIHFSCNHSGANSGCNRQHFFSLWFPPHLGHFNTSSTVAFLLGVLLSGPLVAASPYGSVS